MQRQSLQPTLHYRPTMTYSYKPVQLYMSMLRGRHTSMHTLNKRWTLCGRRMKKEAGDRWQQLEEIAMDREEWRRLTRALCVERRWRR